MAGRRITRGALLGLVLFAVPVAAAQATITVANTNDAGAGSLRQAIVNAASSETIVVPAGTYTLTSGELAIAKSVTISGHAAADTIIRAGGASRIFHTSGAANTVTINGVTIRDGHVVAPAGIAKGAGVWNQDAVLNLSDVVVTNNHVNTDGNAASPGGPGGIANGGGLANDSGTLTLLRGQVTNNAASALGGIGTGAGAGGPGGIARGGGIFDAGTLNVTDSTFAGNAVNVTGGQGAGSANGGPGGIADGGGGYLEPGSNAVSVASSTFSGNALDSSGGLPGAGGAAGPGGLSRGGGIYASASSLVIALTDVTVTANTAGSSGAGTAQGGGIYGSGSGSGKLNLTNDTLAANTASGASGAAGGNLRPNPGVQLKNTILSAGAATAGAQSCVTAATSLGHNLEDTSPSQCGFTPAVGDRIGMNPLLGSLQANGGPTQTMALLGGSPAIDAGDNSGCPATDQRGVLRPQGVCDIGAYESAPGTAFTGLASGIDTTSATLAGTATNPDVVAGTAAFQYGTTTAYGQSTAAQPVAPGASAAPIVASITGLTPGTTWHFRTMATNPAGTAFGADQTFVTTAVPPAVIKPPLSAALSPVLSGLTLSPSAFRAATSGASSATRVGTTVRYKLSKAARVTFRVERATKGRSVGGRCVRATRALAKRKACTRYLLMMGSFSHQGTTGPNKLKFRGRLRGHRLKPGRYRLRAVAKDPAGKSSALKRVRFRIARR